VGANSVAGQTLKRTGRAAYIATWTHGRELKLDLEVARETCAPRECEACVVLAALLSLVVCIRRSSARALLWRAPALVHAVAA